MLIAHDVFLVKGRRGGANVYLLLGEDVTLVDTGMPGNGRHILAQMADLGVEPHRLRRIVITHCDVDHIGSLAELVEATGASVLAHPADSAVIEGEEPLRRPLGTGWWPSLARGLFRLLPLLFHYRPVKVTQLVQEGHELPGGWKVLHTPGHTLGSISLYNRERRVILVGDAMNNRWRRLKIAPPIFTADVAQAHASIRRIAELDFDVCGFGHGPPLLSKADRLVRDFARRL